MPQGKDGPVATANSAVRVISNGLLTRLESLKQEMYTE
jgi:hypothetical protein